MKAKNIKFIAIFLVLLFCLVGAVSATEDISTHTQSATKQAVTTSTSHEDLSNVQTDPIKNSVKTNSVSTTKTKKETTAKINTTTNITKSSKKNNKLGDSESTDFYVSDNDGSDDNDGSQTSPFKTIKTAIDKTTNDKIYNIHILEGTYKGLGNTNLTVNGDYNINFIGSGTDKTFIDGDAKFTLPSSGNDAWGGSAFWNSWSNVSGNWFMNITRGTGKINIHDFTIQNCWSSSGSAITLCYSSTIDNYATLNATNIYFNKNHAGNGAGIRNNNGGTLYVNNCTFENGTKAQSTGNFGAAIYNNGTATVTNTYIINNYARWGSVTNDKNITMINCTFSNNHAYDGGSGYKNGPSFAADTGITNYFQMYAVFNLTSTIINCTFEDNEQCDISNGRGDLLVDNCIFNHSTGIYLFPNNNRNNQYLPTQIITNNQFIDMQPSTVFATLISSTTPSVAVRSLSTYNVTIENNSIDVKNTDYGYGLYLTANALVKNNTLNNYIYLNGENNTIINNTIETNRDYTISLANAAKNAVIANNTLISAYANGDLSIGNVLASTTLENNVPLTSTFIINDTNYANYFDENGIFKMSTGNKIILSGELLNKKFVFDNVKLLVTGEPSTKLINATIITQNNAQINFQNIAIENANNNEIYAILLNSSRNTLKNVTLTINTDKVLHAVKIEEDSNIITNTTITMNACAGDVDWSTGIGIAPTAAIFIRSSNNIVNNTKIYLNATKVAEGSSYPTVDGIDIQSKAAGEYVTGNELRNTKINVVGGSYVYGLNIARAKDTYTTLTYYNVTSNKCAYGIQIGDSKDNTIAGYIYSYADEQAYGAYITAMSTDKTYNTNFNKLYIQEMKAPEIICICVDGASGLELSDATYKDLFGDNVKVVDIHKDFNDNTPENILINKLTITVTNTNNTSVLMTISDSNNVTIINSTMSSKAGFGINLTQVTNAVVKNNYINVGNLIGGNAAVTSTNQAVIEDNTPTIAVLTDDNYSNFFDENGNCIVDVSVISLGSDLHNKDLIFNKNTTINITNLANYTIYNGTITIKALINTSYNSALGTLLNVIGINFKNTNKPIFIDEINGTFQRNVYFKDTNIEVTGDDIVAFDAYNNKSYIYLDIQKSNITMNGNNVVVVNYSGYNRGQPVYITNNNIDVTATTKAIILNADLATIKLNSNNIKMNAKNAITANLNNSTISYYNFEANNINITAEDATVLNMIKLDTSSSYIDENNITIKASNPTTVINITGSKTVYVQDNQIIVDSLNGETPVIYVNVTSSSYVRRNYIITNDVYGDNAVAGTGITISGNTPKTVHINIEYETLIIQKENTILINITNDDKQTITGNITVAINGEEISVTDNTIKYTPTSLDELNLTITYFDPDEIYGTNKTTFTISIRKTETNIEIITPSEATVNETTTIFIVLKDENNNPITNQKINITIGDNTEELDIKNGFTIYSYIPTEIGEDTITITYQGNDILNTTTNTTTITITPNKDEIINDLNNTINNQTETINDLNNTINNQTETIQEQDNKINNQTETINDLNNTINNQTETIQEQDNKINNLNQDKQTQTETINKLNNDSKTQSEKINTLQNTVKAQTQTIKKQDNKIQTQSKEISTTNKKLVTAKKQVKQVIVKLKSVSASKIIKKSKNYVINARINKAVKGKRVFVIFNGKTYIGKTNAKGVAKVTIKKSAIKKLKVNKKLSYQIIFGDKIVKRVAKIKK